MDRLEGTTKAARKAAAVGSGKRVAVDRRPGV
jgi:hypothetical protein